jgi:two-component sensor histidine kinase
MLALCFKSRAQYRPSMPIDSGISLLQKKYDDAKRVGSFIAAREVLLFSVLYNKRSRYKDAGLLIDEALDYARMKNHKKEVVLFTSERANALKYLGKHDEALRSYFEADELLKSVTAPEIEMRHAISFGEFYRKLGKYNEARLQLERAREIFVRMPKTDTAELIRFYNRYAAIHNESGGDSVISYSIKAIRLSRITGDPYAEAVSMNELGFHFKNRRMLDTAMRCYGRAEEAWRKAGALNDMANAMFNRAQLIAHSHLSDALSNDILKQIVLLYQQGRIDYPIENVYVAIRDNYFFLGDCVNVRKYRLLALEALLQAREKKYQADITKVKEQYENEKMQAQVKEVSGRLTAAEEILKMKDKETRRIYIFLGVVVLLLLLIAFLFYRVYFANKRLEERYREKEALIQEIHHRVKNNLQFVSSLINMQINASPDLQGNQAFHDAARRIKAMSLVHEMLYNNDNTGGILIDKYLTELVQSMNELVNTREIPVDFNVSCGEIDFTTTNAIALGMITSELIANSIKHAFNGVEQPSIIIKLEMASTRKCSFHYSDNGREGFELKGEKKTLGMRLIDIFSRQLKGNYRFETEQGLHYYLQFNV